jgi:HEAT repeat protein
MPPNSFKSDESFLQKLAVGATGTMLTIQRLRELGYRPIELERGSTGYKIWKKIKIKRVRVPDILCLRSGLRFESRGKTKLEISMSHSLKDPHRAWDAGMRPDDSVAIVLCEQAGESPVDWNAASPIHFVKIEDMQSAFSQGKTQITKPKGVEEGSEIRIIWPCAAANEPSLVTEVSDAAVKLRQPDGHIQRCVLTRKNFTLLPQCAVGEPVQQNQIVASTVPIDLNPVCRIDVDEQFFIARLKSASLSERYAAAKALRFRGYPVGISDLMERMQDPAEDIYVQLEAAAALAAFDESTGWTFLSNCLNSEYLTIQLETIIVLSEIVRPESQNLLISILIDPQRDTEIRAGAAWALGEFQTKEAASTLVNTFNSSSTEIKIEAARALLKIAPSHIELLVTALQSVDPMRRDGIAWALARAGGFDISQLLNNRDDQNLRRWISYIAGYGKTQFPEAQINRLFKLDAEVHFAASVLWQILSSWVYELGEY